MTQLIILILFLIFMTFQVKAQSSSPSQGNHLFIICLVPFAIIFSFTFFVLIYAMFCCRANLVNTNHQSRANPVNTNHQSALDGLIRSGPRVSGIDKTVIESLPFFHFSLLKGSREGLECAVCLCRFKDVEVLRLLPKCKHAFHIDCIDQWLEQHSSCPLCRQKVSIDDLSLLTYSNGLRSLWNPSELKEDSNIELFVEREESRRGSSRFSIGSSFRKFEKGKKEEELAIQENSEDFNEGNGKMLHKFNHKIIVSDFVFKNRWSNMSWSDLMFLNSEMINSISSNRFSSLGLNKENQPVRTRGIKGGEIMNIREEMERKRAFESKVREMKTFDPIVNQNHGTSRILTPSEKRSMSEIIVHPRSVDFSINESVGESNLPENVIKDEKMKGLWYLLARRTAQRFANREKRSQTNTSQTLESVNSIMGS